MPEMNATELKNILLQVNEKRKDVGIAVRDEFTNMVQRLDVIMESGIFADTEPQYFKQIRVLHSNMMMLFPLPKEEEAPKE